MMRTILFNEISSNVNNWLLVSLAGLPSAIICLIMLDEPGLFVVLFGALAFLKVQLYYLNTFYLKENRERLLVLLPISKYKLLLTRLILCSLPVFPVLFSFFLSLMIMVPFVEGFSDFWLIPALLNTAFFMILYIFFLSFIIDIDRVIFDRFPRLLAGFLQALVALITGVSIALFFSSITSFDFARVDMRELITSWWLFATIILTSAIFMVLDIFVFSRRSSFDKPEKGFLIIWAFESKEKK
jgi:hypothetical protein